MEATPDHLEAVEERPWKQLVASDSMDGATLASATQFPTIFRSFSLFLFFSIQIIIFLILSLTQPLIFLFLLPFLFLVACYATLYPALSVRPSV